LHIFEKSNILTTVYNQLFLLQEEIFKALAHSRRLEIIHLLRNQELTVSEIYTMLDLPQANVSQHLQILRDNNIVVAKKTGKQISYKIAHQKFLEIADFVRELIIQQHQKEKILDLDINISDLVPLTHDPVCNMRVSSKTAGFVYSYNGYTHYFCASGCLEKFKKDPKKYAKRK
jgi:ArsR family transcriptional regulator, virulence genes transcriptional regulator